MDSRVSRFVPKICSSVLIFFTFFLSSAFIAFSLCIIPNTSATESTEKNTSTSTTDKGYSLSIIVPKSVTIDLTPTPSGSFSYSELNTQVTTTNPTGYTLTFNASDNANNGNNTNANELINTNTNITINNTIPSITTNTTYTNFPTNSWGYSINDNNANIESFTFKPIPTTSSSAQDKQLKVTDTADNSTTPTANTNTKLIIGLKSDNNLASGTYAGQLTFTTVANALPLTFSGITNMQDMIPAICAAETTPTNTATQTTTVHTDDTSLIPEATLTDTRDNKTYVVRKLADGNCWMTQNLRLGGSSAITLTPANTNITSNFTLTASSNSFGTTNDAAGININRMHDNGNTWFNGSSVQTTGTPPSQTQYMGNHYNWYTATAGTGIYEMSTDGQNATSSICPKGWRLPKGGAIDANTGNGEFQQLYNTYGTRESFFSATSAFVFPGLWHDSFANSQGIYGYWWSSTVNNATRGYDLLFNAYGAVSPQYDYKRYGLSVRCIAEPPVTIATINTMQEMTSDVCAASAIGDNKALRDTRDGNTYMVRKMEDNKCWMTQNLRLGTQALPSAATISSNLVLDSTNSDIASGTFTIQPSQIVPTGGNTSWGSSSNAADVDQNHIYNGGNYWIAPTSEGNDSTVNATGTPPNQSQYMGNYYNWYTATAGTGTYAMTSGNASSSICPKGWKLPTGSANSDFTGLTGALVNITTNTSSVPTQSFTMQSALNYFSLAGYYNYYGGVNSQGSGGRWWSSTASNIYYAYILNLGTTYVNPQNHLYKAYGFSVRCVAK